MENEQIIVSIYSSFTMISETEEENLDIFHSPGVIDVFCCIICSHPAFYTITIFSSPEHNMFKVSFYGCPMSIVCQALCIIKNYLVDTLEATFLSQSTRNLVRMFVLIKSQMSSSLDQLGS